MNSDQDGWLRIAESLGRQLTKAPEDPVVFMIGAGASISSGAPTTTEVFDSLTQPHMPPPREHLEPMPADLVSGSVEPLFGDTDPYLGYRCLAAMGRNRKVVVLNLNWDQLVEEACDLIGGVECRSFLIEQVDEIRASFDDPAPGVVVVHLHGRLRRKPSERLPSVRYASLQTLAFPTDQKKLLSDLLAENAVICGASLTDSDLFEAFDAEAQKARQHDKSVWAFMRAREPDTVPRCLRDWMTQRASTPGMAVSELVDFDRLMLILREHEVGQYFDKWSASEDVRLPPAREFIWPNPAMIRPHLDARSIVCVNERHGGASTIAASLSHWIALWSTTPTMPTVHKQTSVPPSVEAGQVALWDVAHGLQREMEAAEVNGLPLGKGRCIVSLSEEHWAGMDGELGDVTVIVGSTRTWFRAEDKLAGRPDASKLTRQVELGDVCSPAEVRSSDRRKADHPFRSDMIEGRRRMLAGLWARDRQTNAILQLVAVRLSQLPLDRTDLVAIDFLLEGIEPDDRMQASFLAGFSLGRRQVYSIPRIVDRIAVDGFISQFRNELALHLVESTGMPAETVDGWFDCWEAFAIPQPVELKTGRPIDFPQRPEAELADYGPTYLDDLAAAGFGADANAMLERLSQLEHDFWSLRELVASVLWRWERFEYEPHEFLQRVLEGEQGPMGVYLVFESFLDLGGDLSVATRHRLLGAITTLVFDPARQGNVDAEMLKQIALIYDGLLWRRPQRISSDSLAYWKRNLDTIADENPSLKGAYLVSHLLHPSDANGGEKAEQAFVSTDREMCAMATWMIDWHLVHQSRGRALLSRRQLESQESHLLDTESAKRRLSEAQARSLKRFLGGMAKQKDLAGWGFHLGANILMTQGRFAEAADYRTLIDCLRAADPTDPGLISALLTYQVMSDHYLSEEVEEVVADDRVFGILRRAMLEGLSQGVQVDSVAGDFYPPRFRYARRPKSVHSLLDESWNWLAKVIPDMSHETVVARLEIELRRIEKEGLFLPGPASQLRARVAAGDYDPLARVANRDPGSDPAQPPVTLTQQFSHLVEAAIDDLAGQERDLRK